MCYLAQGQSKFSFKRWGIEDGLSQSTITQIAQDKAGFIWLGTQDGLNRFDGNNFKVYKHKENDTNSLSNNYVISLVCDSSGNVWVGTTNGLNCIRAANGVLIRIPLLKQNNSQTNFRIHALCTAPMGGIFVATGFGVFYVSENGSVQTIPALVDLIPSGSTSLLCDAQALYFSSAKKIWRYNFKTQQVRSITTEYADLVLLSITGNSIWFRSEKQLKQLHLTNGNVSDVCSRFIGEKAGRSVISISSYETEDWLCTDKGLIYIKEADTVIINHQLNDEKSLSSDFVYDFFKDKAGNYWIGTGREGLNFVSVKNQQLHWYGKSDGIQSSVWHIAASGDTLILATSKGIEVFRKNKGTKVLKKISCPALQAVVKEQLVTAIQIDDLGRWWLGTENDGIYIYYPRNQRIQRLTAKPDDPNTIISNKVMYLSILDANSIGVCSAYGLSVIDKTTLRVTRIFLSELKAGLNNYIMKVTANNGRLIMSSANGLCIFEPKNAAFRQILPDPKHPEEQYHNIVSDAIVAKNGNIWLTTMGYGLHRLNSKTGTLDRFGLKEGLENENLLRLLEDANGDIWTASHDGIAKYSVSANQFINYGSDQGLDKRECTMNGFYEGPTREIYAGMVGGLAVFDPLSIQPDTAFVQTVLSAIKVNYEDYRPSTALEVAGSVNLPTTVNVFEAAKTIGFEFSALLYGKENSVRYNYRLVGFDRNWVELPKGQRLASYSNLPEGNFYFEVIPVVQGLVLKSKVLRFEVNVIPPFYKTLWFRIVLLLLVVSVVTIFLMLFYRRKLRLQKEHSEREMAVQQEKERISRELHDNVGSQLTYIIKSIDSLVYKAEKQPDSVTAGLDSLSDFSRDTLNQLRESIWAINTKQLTLQELILKIQDHIDKINARLSGKHVQFATKVRLNPVINPTLAIGVFRIVQEAVVNSIKYAGVEKTTVTLIENADNFYVVTIADKGQGFASDSNKTHRYGLKNMRARAVEIGANIAIESVVAEGTTIRLSFSAVE